MDTFVYQVLVTCGNGDAWVAYESADEASALARYEQEVASAGEPVDVSDWGDNDQGRKKLYQIEEIVEYFKKREKNAKDNV